MWGGGAPVRPWLFAHAAPHTPQQRHQKRPHIILMVADDLGTGDVFVNGWDETAESVTPTLDALRARGVALTNHYSMQLCTPTRSALLTAKYPVRTGMQHLVIKPTGAWLGVDVCAHVFVCVWACARVRACVSVRVCVCVCVYHKHEHVRACVHPYTYATPLHLQSRGGWT